MPVWAWPVLPWLTSSKIPFLQRGLSLYYVQQFAEAAQQFRDDVAVNPADTEESIWAFLSEAQLLGPDRARAQFLQASSVKTQEPSLWISVSLCLNMEPHLCLIVRFSASVASYLRPLAGHSVSTPLPTLSSLTGGQGPEAGHASGIRVLSDGRNS